MSENTLLLPYERAAMTRNGIPHLASPTPEKVEQESVSKEAALTPGGTNIRHQNLYTLY